jgi:predicted amidohydrolase
MRSHLAPFFNISLLPGHAGANLTPVIASNRYGREKDMIFYGLSFIADQVNSSVSCSTVLDIIQS